MLFFGADNIVIFKRGMPDECPQNHIISIIIFVPPVVKIPGG